MGIITTKIIIKTTNKNITHYQEYYPEIKSGDEININVCELPITSKQIIEVECDICLEKNNIHYYSYLRNIKNYEYYSCKKCSVKKAKNTNIRLYGVEHPLQSQEILEKMIHTNQERYGVDYVNQLEQTKNKIIETNNYKYGVDYYTQTKEYKEKNKKTNIIRYGVEYPMQNKDVYDRTRETCLNKYNVEFVSQLENTKIKTKQTKKNKYNDENYNNREKYIKTNIEKYGVENPMQIKEIQQKLSNVIFEKYGVYYPVQLEEFYLKMIKSGYKIEKYNDTELYYQGTYEKDFLDNYYQININRGPTIKYIYNDVEHIYYSDFYYSKLNLIIEIKSKKWFDEHKDKNLIKEKSCREQGYNFIFIIDKDYKIFDKMIKHDTYNKEHCWQYDLRLQTYDHDVEFLKTKDIDIKNIDIKDFELTYIGNNDKKTLTEITEFIKKYEWLGKMPNRPTHRFIATYKGILGGVIVMSTPNSFSKFFGENTKDIEKLISRGACASWTPKNLASKLLMYSIRWMVKNTPFRLFEAYSDTEAKEIGTIYQACNFYYLGQNFGSNKLYFDLNNPSIGWSNSRGFGKIRYMQKIAKDNGIKWQDDWGKKYTINWDNIPIDIVKFLKDYSKNQMKMCLTRNVARKHKYIYILAENDRETKKLRKKFLETNNVFEYPKNR